MVDQQPDIVAEASSDSDDEFKVKQKYVKYDTESSKLDSSGLYYKDTDSELEMESDSDTELDKDTLGKTLICYKKTMQNIVVIFIIDWFLTLHLLCISAFSDSDTENKKVAKITKLNTLRNSKVATSQAVPKNHPLLTDLDNTDPISRRSMKAELWFQKDSFKDIDEDDDEGVDLDKLVETYKEKGKKVAEDGMTTDMKSGGLKRKLDDNSSDDDSSDSDYEVEDNVAPTAAKAGAKSSKKVDFEVVAQDPGMIWEYNVQLFTAF